ncbi:hypothetical protein K4K48_006169 [Colletotrichum sp. SAR 10_66]|nr:hypothetical protein K4K48_006169 [Colletotrichum sp. SAR 10_66]
MLNSTSSTLSSWLKREKTPVSDPEKGNPAPEQPQNLSFISSTLDPHGTLDRFRFRDLQSLHKHADVVQKTSLVLELNIGVLRDIGDYYKYLAATEFQDTPQAKAIIEEFLREVSAISRRLETRMKQLRSLNAYLDQGMALYEKVLQQRSNQISTMFAEIAMANNQQMQQISDKTAKQTTSMHVITVATLFFLPATFVAGGTEDSKLPLDTTPYAYSEISESLHVFDEFQKEQWKFCPLEFDTGDKLSNRHISPYHVVPILEKEKIDSRRAADEDEVSIYKVKLHPKCFHQTVVVFKVFGGDDPETAKMYLNEVDMYSQLVRESAFDHIIRYFGSFETAGLRTIVLEYANGGSLKSFFLNNTPPHDQSNRKKFWNSLMGLLRGLENIHNLNETKRYAKGAWVLRG